MASKGTKIAGVVVILVVMLWGETMAQSGCTTALIGLAPCLNYVSGNSSTPSSSCCSQLSNVVQGQPRCLCSLLNSGGSSFGVTINQTAALALPGACNVQTPPVSQCNGAANGPTSSIADSPASTPTSNSPSDSFSGEVPAEAPEAPSTSSNPTTQTIHPGGSKSLPVTNNNASNGAIITAPTHVLAFVFVMVLCAFTMTKF